MEASPRITLMAAFPRPLARVPLDGGVVLPRASAGAKGGAAGEGGPSDSPALEWVCRDSSKPQPRSLGAGAAAGGGGAECWTAVASAARTRALLAPPADAAAAAVFRPQTPEFTAALAAALFADLDALLGPFEEGGRLPQPSYLQAQRWGGAFPLLPPGSPLEGLPCLAGAAQDAPFAACGDWACAPADGAAGGGPTPVERAALSGMAAAAHISMLLGRRTSGA